VSEVLSLSSFGALAGSLRRPAQGGPRKALWQAGEMLLRGPAQLMKFPVAAVSFPVLQTWEDARHTLTDVMALRSAAEQLG